MSDASTEQRNAFQQTLLGLEYAVDQPVDIFSESCVETFREAQWTQFGYVFTQIFEPAVLREIALLGGVEHESLVDLSCRPTHGFGRLAEMADAAQDLSVVELVNVAAALVSVSRFHAAGELLALAVQRASTSLEKFEIAWLEFLISNRQDDGAQSAAAFETMRAAIEAGGVPRGRVMDVCTQAVVWYLKRREVSDATFTWAVRTGHALARDPDRLDQGTVSSWYRGIAMLPAAKRESRKTRAYMELAREAAEQSIAQRPRAFEKNTIKTYYESTMKEHLYVTRDLDAAVEAGRSLIDLDPVWSPSYGELAEVYEKFGNGGQAAELYEQAALAGPPYVGFHLLRAARCHARLGHDETALEHYLKLTRMAPRSERVCAGGLEVARRLSHPSAASFERALAAAAGAETKGGTAHVADARVSA